MRSFVLALAVILAAVPTLNAPLAARADVVDGNENPSSGSFGGLGYRLDAFFQSFTPVDSGTLQSMTFWTAGGNAGTVVANIRAVDGVGAPTGVALGTLTGENSAGRGTSFTLKGEISVQGGVQYAVDFEAAGDLYGSGTDGNVYADGRLDYTDLPPANAGWDLKFTTQIDIPSVVSPTITGVPPAGMTLLPYSFDYNVLGTPAPTSAQTSGQLPPGLTYADGHLSGTPTRAGTFTFGVTATNRSMTPSLLSTTMTITSATPPGPPSTVVAVTTSQSTATVTVTPSATSGDMPVTGYTISSIDTAATCEIIDATATPLSCEVTGLTRGTTYAFTATAISDAGASAPSAPSNSVVPSVAPLQPSTVTVVPGDSELTVTWFAPLDDGGRPLGAYYVSYRVAGTTEWGESVAVAGLSTSVSGLTNGTNYDVRVEASTAFGVGAESIISATPFRLEPAVTLPGGLSVTGATVQPGDVLTVTGNNLPVGAVIAVELHSTPVHLGTTTVGATGSFSIPVTIPQNTPAGAHSIVLLLTTDGGPTVTNTTPITVVVPATGPAALVTAGFNAGWLSSTVAILLLFGVSLLVFARRRRSASPPARGAGTV